LASATDENEFQNYQRVAKMSPLETENPLIKDSSLQHTRQKIVNVLKLQMNRGKLREKLEAHEISEWAQ
jgi:DNA-binding protein Fis